jgi:hypothetical protein
MIGGATFRGQPLLLLAAILAAWLGMRLTLWEPAPEQVAQANRLVAVHSASSLAPKAAPAGRMPAARGSVRPVQAPHLPAWRKVLLESVQSIPLPLQADFGRIPIVYRPQAEGVSPAPMRATLGHGLLLSQKALQMKPPPALAANVQGDEAQSGVPAAAPMLVALPARSSVPGPRRWAADGWLLLRHDTTSPILSGRPSYGRSQAGATVRYGLAPSSPLRPLVYLRASAALAGARDQEVATGFSVRLLPVAPLRIVAEVRAGEVYGGTRLRPAVYAVTELAPVDLSLGARAEAYLQGGYVGGDFATPFVDGQVRIERTVGRLGETELRAGAGAWGGAQKEAARFDAGPSAAIVFRVGEGRGRLMADYRFRLAGGAEPSSGPALTLSAGF